MTTHQRNPFSSSTPIVDSPDCAANTRRPSRLVPDAEDAESAPTLSLVIPNACHDGADRPCADGAPAGPAAADAWLKEQLEPLLASKAYKDDGLVLLTFDTAPDATKPVGALLISDAVEGRRGRPRRPTAHANLLRRSRTVHARHRLGEAAAQDVHAVFSITKPSR